jgi:hypothetical protein
VGAVYEANIRFEHCYRLDLDPRVAPGHRSACWKEWSQRYTYGQTRDRLDYARRRIQALASGDVSRPVLDPRQTDAGASAAESPAPTSVHAPPPPKAAQPAAVDAGAPDATASQTDAGPLPPGADCVADCRASWRACGDVCNPDAGRKKRGSCGACDVDYGRCVQRCFK